MGSSMSDDISNWIFEYTKENNITSLVVGISGGIDSSLVSTLCCETGLKTILVSLPIKQEQNQLIRANNHAKWLMSKFENITFIEKDLTSVYEMFISNFTDSKKISCANTRSRLRMMTLYHISSEYNGIVVGTGNKVEDFGIGFFTKYGDGGVDISPIANLTKSEVRILSKELGILSEIIEAPPTDGLWDDDRTDEDQIGCSYEDLEWAMSFTGDLSKLDEKRIKLLNIYSGFNKRNKHKMVPIPVYKKSL